MYISSNRTAKYMMQKLPELKGEINKSTTVVGEFFAHFSIIDW